MPVRPPEISIEQEVLANIRNQRIAEHTVADLRLPDDFLRRIADRIIRESFQERFRVVVRSPGSTNESAGEPAPGPAGRHVNVVRAALPDQVRRARIAMPEGRPGLPGYRAALGAIELASPFLTADLAADPGARRAAELIGRRLATDGLLATLAQAIEALGPARAVQVGPHAPAVLSALGLPADLLSSFSADREPASVVSDVAAQLSRGATFAALRRELSARPFRFAQSAAGFRAFSEGGEHAVGLVRLQLTRGSYWGGRGAGGSLDVLRQLLAACPDARFVVSAEETHVPGILQAAADWPPSAERRVTVAAEVLPVAQWAQDNGKPGEINGTAMTLLPRYASRGEDGAIFVPGETFLADGLQAAGLQVVQSPLHFQGGNLLLVSDPTRRERVLLIGEAEVHRNTALGLTSEQATEALRIEFGADRTVVLPAAAFHIDYEVSVRNVSGHPVAFVNDTLAAVRLVLERGIEGLHRSGALATSERDHATRLLESNRIPELQGVLIRAITERSVGPGLFPEVLAAGFSEGPADLAAANFRVFLLALDSAAADLMTPGAAPPDRQIRAYFEAFRRRNADRRTLIGRLRTLGWRVEAIPSFSDGAIGPNAINGIHEPRRYLMPAWGGFFSPLDDAAAAAFTRVLGPGTEISRIWCGESQRRLGGIHCSVSVGPPG